MTYEIAKKIVSAGDSKIFQNWHDFAGITEEDFLEGIHWLCEERRYPKGHKWAGLLRRELGCTKDGLVKLRRVYTSDGCGGWLCTLYECRPMGCLWRGYVSLSADDRV